VEGADGYAGKVKRWHEITTWYILWTQVSTMKSPPLCPVETTVRIVGGRWKAAVLEQLFRDAQRFSELKRAIPGITQRTLSQQLRELQTAGIVDRTVHPPLGESLRPLLDAMCRWGKSHSAAMALKKIRASDR